MVAPLSVVAEIDALFAAGIGGGEGTVGIEDGTPEELLGLLLPHPGPHRVDAIHQRVHLSGRLESPAEVAGRRGVGDAGCPQSIQIRLVVAEQFDVLQTVPSGQNVIADVQHVIRFVIRQMNLQQVNIPVNGIDQSNLAGQQMNRTNPAAGDGAVAITDIVMDVACRQHRPGACLEPADTEPLGDASLASKPFCVCSVLHSKRLRACVVRRS